MNKGDKGYFIKIKRREQLKCFFQFLAVILFLVIGYITTQTKLNYFTLFAVLSCLPASKTLVGVIVKFPIKSISDELVETIENNSEYVTIAYNTVLSSKEKLMPIDCIAISGNKIFGYVSNEKVNLEEATHYIRNFYNQEKHTNINIKLFHEFSPFMSRVEGLNNMASIDTNITHELEEDLKRILLLFCM